VPAEREHGTGVPLEQDLEGGLAAAADLSDEALVAEEGEEALRPDRPPGDLGCDRKRARAHDGRVIPAGADVNTRRINSFNARSEQRLDGGPHP
jgi:hypothetical protein